MNKKFLVGSVLGIAVAAACTAAVLALQTEANDSATSPAPPSRAESGLSGVFEGVTPCSKVERPLPQIRPDADCEMAIWRLVLGPGSAYTLDSSYGTPQQGTPDIQGGGTRITLEGTWTEARGTQANPDAAIIRLETDNPQTSLSFLKVSDDILHLLDDDGRMRTGNASWSYTLSRTGRGGHAASAGVTRAFIESEPPLHAGTFEGRTPYQDFLRGFGADLVPGRLKVKWLLTFCADPVTGNPERYIYSVPGRADSSEGRWSIIRGTPQNPDATVYQLTPANGGPALSLLKLGDNHLFFLNQDLNPLAGDARWSFTLSRTNWVPAGSRAAGRTNSAS